MNTEPSSLRTSSLPRRLGVIALVLAGSALWFTLSPSRLGADAGDPLPAIRFTQGLVGKQVCLQWDAQPGVQYLVQKALRLVPASAPSEFVTVALVTAATGACQWVDPAPSGAKAFYRIEIPAPQVFSLEPPVLSTSGGDIFLRAQLLPPNSFLALEIPGQPTVFIELSQTGEPGLWRAGISSGAIVGIAIGSTIRASVVDSNGVTVCPIEQTIEITTTGYASDAPPWLPPAAPSSRLKVWQLMQGQNSTEAMRKMMGQPKISEATAVFRSSSSSLPGEVTIEMCPLSLEVPAGPPLDCVLTYRSMVASGSLSSFGPNWTCAYDISVTPIPAGAGSSATQVKVCDGSGRCDVYTKQADATFTCDGMFRTGTFSGDTFTLSFADHGRWVFRAIRGSINQGKISSIIDRNNVALSCTYTPEGYLASVASQFGQSLSFTHNFGGLITRITDHTGRYCDFSYNTDSVLASCSCPQLDGTPSVAGPTTFTYTSGFADSRRNHNLLTCRDGASRLLCSHAYSSSANPLDVDFDRVVSSRCSDSPDVPGATCSYSAMSTGLFVCDSDELGRVTETIYDRQHRPVQVRDYTGFSVAGIPVTPASNRPANPLRTSDPSYYQTTCAYNAQHCPTVCTEPDGLQTRCTYQYDFSGAACPVSERGNVRVCTLVSAGGEQRTVSMTYLPNFGSPEPVLTLKTRTKSNQTNERVMASAYSNPLYDLRTKYGSSTVRGEECDDGDPADDGLSKATVGMGMGKGMYNWIQNSFDKRESPTKASWGIRESPTLQSMLRESPSKQSLGRLRESPSKQSLGGLRESPSKQSLGKLRESPSKQSLGKLRESPSKQSLAKQWTPANYRTSLTTTYGQTFTDTYDTAGNCTACRTPITGAGCDIAYNALGQVTSITTLNGPGSSFLDECVYDAATHFCSGTVCDGTGLHLTTACARDALGRITSETDERGFDTLFTYNPCDQVVTIQSPLVGTSAATASRITTTCFYDAGGLPSGCDVQHCDATGALVAANPAYSTRYVRDSAVCPLAISRVAVENRPVSLPPGSLEITAFGLENFDVCDYTYNAAGECVEERTPGVCLAQTTDVVTSYEFDERGLVHRCISGLPGLPDAMTTECDYTPGCDLSRCAVIASSPAESPTETYLYDGFHRCISSTDPMGNVQTFSYDNKGYMTCSLLGELDDVAGSAGNVLLSRCRSKTSEAKNTIGATGRLRVWQLMQGQSGTGAMKMVNNKHPDLMRMANNKNPELMRWTPIVPKPQEPVTYRTSPAFFDVFTEDDISTIERFTPGSAAPPALEITTCDRSPAGLVMSVSTNGDLLASYTYDTVGRSITCSNGACSSARTLDACDNVIVCSRTDFSSAGGNSHLGSSCAIVRDALGRAVQITEGSSVTACDFDSCDRVVRYAPPSGAPIFCDYDEGTAAQPYSIRTRCDVDGNGSLETLESSYSRILLAGATSLVGSGSSHRSRTDSNGFTTTFTCDSQGRCVQTSFPDGSQESCAFDNLGRCVSQVRKTGGSFDYTYNLGGQLLTIFTGPCKPPYLCDFLDVPATTYRYNGLGDCSRMTQGASDLLRTFDSCGNLISESQNGHLVQHTYTHRGCASTTYPDGTRFNEVRNAQGLLLSCSAEGSPGPAIFSVQYQGVRPVQETRANGVVTTCVYRGPNDDAIPGAGADFSVDACVQSTVTSAGGAVLSSSTYNRDRSQRLIRCDTLFSSLPIGASPLRRQVIARDRLGRVVRVQTGKRESAGSAVVAESDVSYTLDLEGQRLAATGGANPGFYIASDALPPGDRQMHQYSAWPGGALEWDNNGSLTVFSHGAAGARRLVYDACSRLAAVVDNGTGAMVASFGYDAEDRLISRTIPSSDPVMPSETTFFIYDGQRCIQELGADGLPDFTFAAIGHCIISRNGTYVYPHGGGGAIGDSFTSSPGGGMPHVKRCSDGGAMPHVKLMTGSTGAPIECFDADDGGRPLFLTSEGIVRQGATTALSGYKWMAPECLWCPESGLFVCPDGDYSPDLGLTVSACKTKPKEVKSQHEYVGHVTLIK